MINIIVAGPRGKMGRETIHMINREEEFRLVACIDRKNNGKTLKELDGFPEIEAPIYDEAETCFQEITADVFIDLTVPEAGYQHALSALKYNIRPVIGTSGITEEQLREINDLADRKGIGTIIAPNFAIGAILMMKFSKMAAAYLPNVEIIEKHHDNKLDAPSGTAIKTAELIRSTREKMKQGHPEEKEILPGARGANVDGMRIHSLRLPGLVAHQEVIFGGAGQTLSIKHDSLNRESFMEGIKVSVYKVMDLNHFVYGLENII